VFAAPVPVTRPTQLLLALALVSALTACDRNHGGGNAGFGAGDGADVLANGTNPEELAQLMPRVQAALAGLVPDALSARYANLRRGTLGTICGEVETGMPAALHPFIVTAEDVGMVSATPTIRIDDPTDSFPDLYMRHCATVEELRRMDEAMNAVTAALPPLPPESGPPALVEEPAISEDDVPPGQEPGQPDESARRGDDESFFNAIVRTPRSAAPHR